MRTRIPTIVTIVVLALAGCASGGSAGPGSGTSPGPGGTGSGTAAISTGSIASTTGSAASSSTTTGTGTVSGSGLVALWPFTSAAQAQAWQTSFRSGGSQPWHLDVDRTALAFTRDHLGYTEIDRVTTRSVNGTDARLGVGWNDPNETTATVAVLHLIRLGAGQDAPWVVVGTDDTLLSLSTPRYGTTVTSPLTVGGLITGVDESLHVKVLPPASPTPLGEVVGIPAGGERTPWSTAVSFAAPAGTVLTVAVSTGGHLKNVERFAITAVRVG
jgi:hypothetical protein